MVWITPIVGLRLILYPLAGLGPLVFLLGGTQACEPTGTDPRAAAETQNYVTTPTLSGPPW